MRKLINDHREGDGEQWDAVADWFMARRNANNSSFTLHELKSGKLACKSHQIKVGQNHN